MIDLLPLFGAPVVNALAVLLIGSGKGAAAAPILFHRPLDGPSAGLGGLLMFVFCMGIIVYAFLRLRNRTNP